jgi:hypothetical protein
LWSYTPFGPRSWRPLLFNAAVLVMWCSFRVAQIYRYAPLRPDPADQMGSFRGSHSDSGRTDEHFHPGSSGRSSARGSRTEDAEHAADGRIRAAHPAVYRGGLPQRTSRGRNPPPSRGVPRNPSRSLARSTCPGFSAQMVQHHRHVEVEVRVHTQDYLELGLWPLDRTRFPTPNTPCRSSAAGFPTAAAANLPAAATADLPNATPADL